MKFFKVFVIVLILSYVFAFFGGWMLFDFHSRFWLATAVCAFIVAVIVYAFVTQEGKIEELEKRIRELEEKNNNV